MPELLSDMLVVGGNVSESAAGVYTTTELVMPVSIRAKIGIIIVGIDFETDTTTDVPGALPATEKAESFLMEEDIAAAPDIDDDNVIAKGVVIYFGDAAGTGVSSIQKRDYGFANKLLDPMLEGWRSIAQKLFIGIDGSNAAVVWGTDYKLYYYVAKFTEAEFLELALKEAYT